MNIEILPSTQEETLDFEEREWPLVDEEHWGREISWDVFDYRFVARFEGEIIGVIFGKFEAGVAYVDNLLIAKKHRGKGIGTKMMSFIEHWTTERGGHKVWLVTHTEWEANQLYKKLGYDVICTLKKHFLNEDFYLYEKILN